MRVIPTFWFFGANTMEPKSSSEQETTPSGGIVWSRKELGVIGFVAVCADDNVASGNVIRKCGLTFAQHTPY